MKKTLLQLTFVATLVAFSSLIAACSSDSNTAGVPTTGSTSGTVTFTGSWPAIGEVQVSIYSNLGAPYVPMGPPDQASPVIQGTPATFDYDLTGLDKGDYTAIFVSWRDPQNPQGARLLGVYGSTIDSQTGAPAGTPTSVTIEDGFLNHPNLDFTANLDLVP